MASLNKHQIVGYLGNDPDIRYKGNGDPVANFSVATSSTWKDKETGEKKERTEWHRVVFHGKTLIENFLSKYVKSGSLVFVEGESRTRSYVKDDVKHWVTEIIGNEIQLLDRKPPAHESAPDDVPLED